MKILKHYTQIPQNIVQKQTMKRNKYHYITCIDIHVHVIKW
jgi:hypothetical protein